MTNRDPQDPKTTGDAVSTWLATEDGDHGADAELARVLLEQGVISPADTIESIDTPEEEHRALVILTDKTEITVDEWGQVTVE
jgi:hypothetical protein